jgi:hypothetical protein
MAVQLLDEGKTRDVKDSDLPIPDGDPNTVYTIREITKATYRKFIKDHTKKVPNRQTRGMVEETDFQAVSDDLLDWALVKWSGVTLGGVEVSCTSENKALLDTVRSSAILDIAGIGQVEEGPALRKASFRESESVA